MNNETREDLKLLEERVKSAINMAQKCEIDFIYHERPVFEIQKRHEKRHLQSKDEYLKQRFGALFRDYGNAFTPISQYITRTIYVLTCLYYKEKINNVRSIQTAREISKRLLRYNG